MTSLRTVDTRCVIISERARCGDSTVAPGSAKAGSVEAGSVEAGSVEAGSLETGSLETGSVETASMFDALVNPQIDVDGKAYAKYSEDFFFGGVRGLMYSTKVSKKPIYADGSFSGGIQSRRVQPPDTNLS